MSTTEAALARRTHEVLRASHLPELYGALTGSRIQLARQMNLPGEDTVLDIVTGIVTGIEVYPGTILIRGYAMERPFTVQLYRWPNVVQNGTTWTWVWTAHINYESRDVTSLQIGDHILLAAA